jgi:DNA-binding transcriptional LysR family regulator
MIESRYLIHFIEIADRKSYARAAKQLHLSQPALTRSIQKLEALLGVKLFHRGGKRISLTVFGETLLPRARRIVNSLNDTKQAISALKGLQIGELRVGFGPVYTDLIASSAISQFIKMYPGIKIRSSMGPWPEMIKALDDSIIDLFVGEISTIAGKKDYCCQSLKKRPAVYFCRAGHPAIQKEKIDVSVFSSYPLIAPQLPERLSFLVPRADEQPRKGTTPFHYSDIVCDSFQMMKQIVKESNAIGVIPKALIATELMQGTICAIPVQPKKLTSLGGIVYIADREPSPATMKFIKIVKNLDKELH